MPEEMPEKEALPEVKVEAALEKWKPKTSLGKQVFEGKITDIEEIFRSGKKISEPEIVDKLVPNIKSELIMIGGRKGKGGGMQRIPVRITATMHKSGRRFTTTAFVVVGNEDGIVGIGKGSAPETRDAIEKAIQKAKLSVMKAKRGCGSFECSCEEQHSIPFKVEGKSGSVRVVLLPAPRGVGLVADDESKKILRLAGIKDVWVRTFGNTSMRINLISAIYDALKKLYVYEKGA
ncbi:MAG: 30S ribosomal protein S5 [Candidatus Aenigmarchaeota archaeon]|nr:30S ribosomal protein S5 [Candidatus Aenigmarchaeota archaeon]